MGVRLGPKSTQRPHPCSFCRRLVPNTVMTGGRDRERSPHRRSGVEVLTLVSHFHVDGSGMDG